MQKIFRIKNYYNKNGRKIQNKKLQKKNRINNVKIQN